jgi:general stress protein YciG
VSLLPGEFGDYSILLLTPLTLKSDGLKMDGTPDKRVNPEHGFGADHERASELGKQGGKTGGSIGGDAESTGESGGDGADYK